MSCPDNPNWCLYAGEKRSYTVTVTDSAGDATDLTGATIYCTAKHSTSDTDADAVFSYTVTSHTNAAGGISAIPVDLTGLDNVYFAQGATLSGDIVVKDSAGNVLRQETMIVKIHPAPTRSTS